MNYSYLHFDTYEDILFYEEGSTDTKYRYVWHFADSPNVQSYDYKIRRIEDLYLGVF